ncbi:MAG: imidazolonepropionase [Armatimonadota bacterium]|nr:imidazolonepropionase [Armatimonadota bacterium]MDR5696808.1 imidazolonepropionase [Armatimonadota bacterium]
MHTLAGTTAPRRGAELRSLGTIGDGAVAARGGRIVWVGQTDDAHRLKLAPGGTELDAAGRCVVPGFVDPHTHLVWAGSRADEWEMRLAGASYEEIAARGGGILSTTRATREAADRTLRALADRRLDAMLRHGTTTAEAKSGYGLDRDTELRTLRVVRDLAESHPVDLAATFLGAHAVPAGFEADAYVDFVCEQVIPAVAAEGLAEFCDVFCERGAFSAEQSRRILRAGRRHGLRPKIHADEFSDLGGARLAVEEGAVSADHLLRVGEVGIRALAASDTIAVLLPGTALFLGVGYAPARRLIEAGAAVALGTDHNPGSSPTLSMQAICALACSGMKMHPAEALTAATVNAAHAIGRAHDVGSIEVAKRADLVVLDCEDYREMMAAFGTNLVWCVVKSGRCVS